MSHVLSALLLALLLVAVPAVAFAMHMRRSKLTVIQEVLYWVNWTINRLVWRTQVNRPLPLVDGQGAVVIANHRSGVDPLFLQVGTRQVIHWMVAREFCDDPKLAWLFRLLQAIPVGRGGIDTGATKQAIRLAREGECIGMMPEGRINSTDQFLLPGRPGAALVALKARVPVIPCYIAGAPYDGTALGPIIMPAHVRVTVGDPIDISEFYDREKEDGVLAELTRRLLQAIADLAGVKDFTPQLAGRHWKPDENGEPFAADAQ